MNIIQLLLTCCPGFLITTNSASYLLAEDADSNLRDRGNSLYNSLFTSEFKIPKIIKLI